MSEEVDSWTSMFAPGPPVARKREREQRAKRERAAQRTDKQRERNAVRTAQINYRCAPAHKDLAHALKEFVSYDAVADVMEEALQMFAEAKGYKG
jgi:hypothetical protein